MYLYGLKGNHRTIQKDHFSTVGLLVSGTVVYEPVSAYQTSGTELLIVPKETWLQQVYNGIVCIARILDPASFYLGFPPFRMVFVGALLVFDGLE